jgi:hypothetical protein
VIRHDVVYCISRRPRDDLRSVARDVDAHVRIANRTVAAGIRGLRRERVPPYAQGVRNLLSHCVAEPPTGPLILFLSYRTCFKAMQASGVPIIEKINDRKSDRASRTQPYELPLRPATRLCKVIERLRIWRLWSDAREWVDGESRDRKNVFDKAAMPFEV